MNQEIFDRVRSIIVEELDVDLSCVTPDAGFRGARLRADSLDLISLVVTIAREFDVEMRDAEMRRIVTVAHLVDYLERSLEPRQ